MSRRTGLASLGCLAGLALGTGLLLSGLAPLLSVVLREHPTPELNRMARPPLGLPALALDRLPTPEMIALGRKLFFDRNLSANGTMACGTCHIPEQGFTNNELATPLGVEGRSLRRNAPTLLNAAYLTALFHDGRDTSLETQALMPLIDKSEMANASLGHLLAQLRSSADYRRAFETAFGGPANADNLGQAFAAYQRSLLSANSAFDRWRYGGDAGAMNKEAIRGFALFTGKAGCSACHLVGERDALFTDNKFHNTGIGDQRRRAQASTSPVQVEIAPGVFVDMAREAVRSVSELNLQDDGRLEVTGAPEDLHRYRTPSLRNVGVTAPFMHDGSLASLEDVVRYYDKGGSGSAGQDARIRPLGLSESEIRGLVAFLQSLTGDNIGELIAEARSGS
jgi:cytochrome c peroxidase